MRENNNQNSKRLLIVDSDQEISTLLISYFNEQGIDAKAVSDSDELGVIIEHHRPQVLLVDYTPVLANSQILWRRIKTNPESSNLPLVVYSTTPQIKLLEKQLGCSKIIPKPFDLYSLQDSIMNCFAE